jgi:DNA-binding MarR family transcriptional regulator
MSISKSNEAERGGTMAKTTKASGTRFDGLPDDEVKLMSAFYQALEPFAQIRHDMPMQYVKSFMLVCMEPGLSVIDYANRAGVSQTVMSRHLLDIGDRNRYMGPGFGLITKRQDPMNLRRQEVHLTEKGKQVAHKMVRALRTAL